MRTFNPTIDLTKVRPQDRNLVQASLEQETLPRLRDLCRAGGIKGYYRKGIKKDQIIDLIIKHYFDNSK